VASLTNGSRSQQCIPLQSNLHEQQPEKHLTVVVLDGFILRRQMICDLLRVLRLPFFELASLEQLQGLDNDHPARAASLVLTNLQDFSIPVSKLTCLLGAMSCHESIVRQVIYFTNVRNSRPESPGSDSVSVTKPITLGKLHHAISVLLPSWQDCEASLINSAANDNINLLSTIPKLTIPSSDHLSARILVVDDVLLNQRVITLKLQQRGFTSIDVTSSGLEAINTVQCATVAYDIILMDVMMPEMDGYEATRTIKADPRYKSVPVIGITGNCTTEDVDACLDSGMVAVLAKPIDTDQLFHLLQKYLTSSELHGSNTLLQSHLSLSVTGVTSMDPSLVPEFAFPGTFQSLPSIRHIRSSSSNVDIIQGFEPSLHPCVPISETVIPSS
jgi:CheY-like chemotaxis protein